jgi:competence protein ComEA
MFVSTVAVLGAAVRVVRAAKGDPKLAVQPALERQAKAADSAAHAGRARGTNRLQQGRGRGGRGRVVDSTKRTRDTIARASAGLFDRPGYIGTKLDLDVATLTQIDSLPGVTALMARRIVLDRIAHGPFVTRDGLRRVSGVGQFFLSRIDSLVTYSGTVKQPTAADTAPPRFRRVRAPRRP